jgi:hypothetical protein
MKMANVKELIRDPKTQKVLGEHKVKKEREMICGRKTTTVIRAHYSELHYYRAGESKFSDLFAMCPEHAAEFSVNARIWNNNGGRHVVSGVRGTVEKVEVVDSQLNSVADDKILRQIATLKKEFKRKMNQSGTRNMTEAHWRQMFEEALEEWTVESVMTS